MGDDAARQVDQAIDGIRADYYRKVPERQLVDAAIAGSVASLRDRFSRYVSPREYQAFQNQTEARFDGVGMEVRRIKRGLRVLRVYDGSPAKRAGIRGGDEIVAANDQSLTGVKDPTQRIKGRPGTAVRLTFVKPGGTRLTRSVERATVSVPVVASMRRGRAAVVALSQFTSGAHGELRAAIDRELKAGAKGIVLDLRHNPGGLLDEARLVASIFIPDGTIVSTRGRSQPAQTLTAVGDAIPTGIPVVVLVDHDSASAAEIVTGALKDRGRATVVGIPTFGKGVFQQVKPLESGGALDITVGQYFTPDGTNLGGGGAARRGAERFGHLVSDDQVGGGDAERRVHRGGDRHDDPLYPEPGAEGVRVDRAGAAEGDEDEVARVVAFVDRRLAAEVGHARVDDPLDPLGGVLDRDAERLGDAAADRLDRGGFVELHAAAEEGVGVDEAEDHVGVGDGRLGPTAAVTGRPGDGAGAGRADPQRAVLDPGDRAAAGADRLHRDGRHRDRLVVHEGDRAEQRPAVDDQADVEAGAAHVGGHHVLLAELLGDQPRADDAADRSREEEGDRRPGGLADRGQSTV